MLAAARGIDPQTANALEVVYRFGLRLRCVLNLQVRDINFEERSLVVYRRKGGLQRKIGFKNEDDSWFLWHLVAGREQMNYIFPGLKRSWLQSVMAKSCQVAGIYTHKTHNLRHSYSIKRYGQERAAGATDKEARKQVSLELGHSRRSVTYAYIPPMIRPGRRG